MKNRWVISWAALGAASFLAAGCGDTGVDTGAPASTESGGTNVVNDSIPAEPGAGSAVGANPVGAGTAELREDGDISNTNNNVNP